jgi:glyoxylase-like metal-dependent hydrolase (beta-lactamase superfamily II)
MRIGAHRFDVHVAHNAVTDADVWLYDRRSRVAVLGDLVTLPAPYLDTACPDGWRAALAEIQETPFRIAVPGHGAPMSRADVALYARAMDTFLDCVSTDASAEQCAAMWAEAAAPLLWEGSRAVEYAAEYVPYLRENGGRAPDCQAPL